jgi:organic radical activating enzyme
MENFCKFFKNGLVYNNNVKKFTVAPCCYFATTYELDTKHDLKTQLEEHKKNWTAGDIQKNCKICLDAEKAGANSFRQASFKIIPKKTNGIGMLTVAVNKECNLACTICDSSSSSTWYRENLRNGIKQNKEIQKLHVENHSGETTEKFLSLLRQQNLEDLTYIKFGGGEPLMTDTHSRILDLIPNPKNVSVHYTSNFSIMPNKKVLEQWKKFKLIKWFASLDGVEEQFSLLRWPYKWENLIKFIPKALNEVPNNVSFGIEHTLNMLNIFYYDRFESWFAKNFSKNKNGVQSILSTHTANGLMSLYGLPDQLKKAIEDKYGQTHFISKLLHNQYAPKDMLDSLKYLDRLDKMRGTNWKKVFEEVSQYFVKHD